MKRGRWICAFVALSATVIYVSFAAPCLLGGDSGEMATLYAKGGIAHPPGFPTVVLWMRLVHALLPGVSATKGASVSSALAAGLAVWVFQRACIAWGASVPVAALAGALLALSKRMFLEATEPEVFALEALFAALILRLAAPRASRSGGRRAAALGFVAGVALGGQQAIALVAPAGLFATFRAVKADRAAWRAGAIALSAFALGAALPYVYDYFLCRTADARLVPMWIEAPTLEGLWYHARRGAYGTLSLAPGNVAVHYHPAVSLARFIRALTVDLFGAPLLLVALLFSSRARRTLVGEPGFFWTLVGSFVLAGPLFAALVNLPADGLAVAVVSRFDLVPQILILLVVATAIDPLAREALARPRVWASALAVVVSSACVVSIAAVRRAHRPDVDDFERNVLEAAPSRAVVVVSGDAQWGASLYATYVDRARPDVAFINPGLLRQAWYRRLAMDATGVSFEAETGVAIGPKTTMTRLLATGRPLFYTEWPDAKLNATPHDSFGPLMRVSTEGSTRPAPAALLRENLGLFHDRFRVDLPPPAEPDEWGHALFGEYGRAFGELTGPLHETGDVAREELAVQMVRLLAPWDLRSPGPLDLPPLAGIPPPQ